MDFKLLKEKGGKNEMQLNIKLTKKKRNCKNKNGVTLIALVVTIVVLLILAGVSINALFGNSGIIEKAKEAQSKMNEAKQNDLNALNELNNWLENNVSGTSSESNVLRKQITNTTTNTLTNDTDYINADLQIDVKTLDGCNYNATNINKLEILSGNTTKNITFKNCNEVIIYSDAILENVSFINCTNITVYAGASVENCSFVPEESVVNIKMMGATIENSTFLYVESIIFEKCTLTNNRIEGTTPKYTNCTVDGEAYSN